MRQPDRDERRDGMLDALLELSPERRRRYLDEACPDDSALREDLGRLLDDATPTDDFLERPVLTPREPSRTEDDPQFEAGELLAGRFRIERLIGRGGMGDVYEAVDVELRTPVAIKMIRPAVVDDRAIDRFRREVLRSRRVSHPNVCRVYDLFAHQLPSDPEVRFLTMELLTGVTLADRLAAGGRLPVEDVTRIATQVAAGLDEAHRLQIVHRDLKPSNVMLAGEGPDARAVVMDFGVAVQVARATDDTATAVSEPLAGTDAYMAPEQRVSADVGPAADIYAFGVVLHEMLDRPDPETVRPHFDHTLSPSGDEPPADAAQPGDLPHRWRTAIQACLQESPDARPRSASEVLRLATSGAVSRHRLAIAAATAVVLMGVSLSAFFLRPSSSDGDAPNPTLLVMPFSNETGEAELDTVTDVVRHQVAQSQFLNVLEPSQVSQVLQRMAQPAGASLSVERMREVAWRAGAGALVTGRVWKASGGYALSAQLERREGPPDAVGQSWTRSFDARDRSELQRVIGEIGRWMRVTAGEAAGDVPKADRPVAEVTSSSWQALAMFSTAEAMWSEGRQDDALAFFGEAVRIDPDFALAWMRMGDILMASGELEVAAERWKTALAVMPRRQLAPREEYRIRGVYANDTSDWVEAERVYRLWLVLYPNDPLPFFYIAQPLRMLGRVDEGIRMLEAAQQRSSIMFSVPVHLGIANLRAGRLDAAKLQIARLRELNQPAWAEGVQGQLEFLSGQYDAALRRFEALEQVDHPHQTSRAPSLQAAVLADTGRPRDAIARLERGAAADLRAGRRAERADKLLAMAMVHLRLGQRQTARDLCIQVEQIDQSALRLAQAASLLARAGYPAEAQRVLERLDPKSTIRSMQVDRHRIQGEILLARGDARAAWSAFQKAAALDAPGSPHEYLARGAAASGEDGTALALYERMAGDPGYYWQYPDSEPPGAWLDALDTYLRLAARISPTKDTSVHRRRYRALVHPNPSTQSMP